LPAVDIEHFFSTLGPRSFLRLIGRQDRTDRDPDLYFDPVDPHSGSLTFSALYAFKLNRETVSYAGFGGEKALTEEGVRRKKASGAEIR
jgi:hypothetical protein